MNPSDIGFSGEKLNAASLSFAKLREKVMDEWVCRVLEVIPATADLGRPVLTNTLPVFYDAIAQALTPDYPREEGTGNTNLATAHGRERAVTTDYSLNDLVHELQIFRHVIFDVAYSSNAELDAGSRNIINSSIDDEIRGSVMAFSRAHEENSQMLIARISHDLRNPLNVASAASQLIVLKSTDSEIKSLANRTIANLAELDKMIQSILDAAVSKKNKLKLQLEKFDIKVLAEEICSDFNLIGGRCEIKGETVEGYWSRNLVKRALENLVSNAFKYGDKSHHVLVNVSKIEGRVLLAVHNEGDVIPESELPRLFSPFERRLEDVDIRGWGLGLPFVQHVAESHSGTVIVDSAEGRGTTFTISMPADCRPAVTSK